MTLILGQFQHQPVQDISEFLDYVTNENFNAELTFYQDSNRFLVQFPVVWIIT